MKNNQKKVTKNNTKTSLGKKNQKLKLNQDKEPSLKKKKLPNNKKSSLLIALLIILIPFLSLIFLYNSFQIKNNLKPQPGKTEKEKINYQDYYFDFIKTLKPKTLYKNIDGTLEEIGMLAENLNLELTSDELLEKGYFKIKDTIYYIDYKDIEENSNLNFISSLDSSNQTYLNYVPFNETFNTSLKTNFYLDDTLLFTINEGLSLPIIIKDDNYYGVIYENKLYYVKKDEGEIIKNQNKVLNKTDKIAALVYHFTYDSNNLEEAKECKKSNITICLSDETIKTQFNYLKENDFYTATMEDISLFVDGKIQLPKKTVVITIDDGYFVQAMINVLEEFDFHATLFLIGKAGNPSDYQSPNLEIHSHTYGLHYTGACSGGQGSPLKCLSRDKILEDLKKSREQLNGSKVFCYPYFEYNDYAISLLKEAGFEMAFIGKRQKIKVGSDKYKLPRYGIINTTTLSDFKTIVN